SAGASAAPHHVFLIDGSGFIFRAYHALPPLSRSDGTPTSAVLGFSNMLAKLLSETDADHIAVVFDASGQTFRNRIYDAYKANRGPPPDDLVPQFALVREATDAFSLCRIEMNDFEAELITIYGDLETLLAHAHEIKQPKRREALIENEAKARLSKVLVKLDDEVPLPCPLEDLRVKPLDLDGLLSFLRKMEFRALEG